MALKKKLSINHVSSRLIEYHDFRKLAIVSYLKYNYS